MRSTLLRSTVVAACAIAVPLSAVVSAAPSAAQTTASTVVINEVESNGDPVGDWVELANTNLNESIDVSGWTIVDNDPKHTPLALPEGSVIESGGFLAFYTDVEGGFGLGGNDSVTLRDAAGNIVDTIAWTQHAATSLGRIPDMTGDFTVTPAPTRGLRNSSAQVAEPLVTVPFNPAGLEFAPAKFGTEADATAFRGEDFSGVDFDANGRAWVVNNDKGELYALDYADGTYSIAGSWQLRYPDGTGEPDAEGVAVTDEGIYVATERDNTHKSISRPSVLRFDVPSASASEAAGELRATQEWNLAEFTGAIGANGGLEAIEFIPELHQFAVGIESTGEVLFVTLPLEGPAELVDRHTTPMGTVASMDYAAPNLRVACDDACEGISQILTLEGTTFIPGHLQARPEGTDNLATEGFASFQGHYLFTDDGATLGTGLLAAGAPFPTSVVEEDNKADDQPQRKAGFGWLLALILAIGAYFANLLPAFGSVFGSR
ncbi:lamin tail domain-containing protein [Corynebacterium sp. 153RC1]|uniref:lamin tail domain-containing protein n=1 Tax=unclassified Corynebacterium TaxID=2624378 RepID=UPI00211CF709|nr:MULTISPECIES: lamin tail domain-containing protein [unclassified Corynebacterium]MCQ9371413.1 lamin tail domain-containing protein [Corynebacterium sp. 35RC1]MCQ9353349.1 lamin tail domain-containing protein [Corynebacterium sp. 209RC1]MCQ9355604.1 lamin tail domain-containing protein [Corynebacterium sp. 1222RC1]MCQ9357788.1 lamin tail domain-containing protein [Corynebacterium sp. 122RC1]MCQ9362125.1 lamin tail domain-containing protein [Corynebacterium sp. 153RC1]